MDKYEKLIGRWLPRKQILYQTHTYDFYMHYWYVESHMHTNSVGISVVLH